MGKITNQDGSRWYTHRSDDGESTERYLSVTTIIDLGVPKPALIGWAAKATAEHAVNNLRKIQSMLEDEEGNRHTGDELAKAKSGAIDWLKGEKNRQSSRAALTGSHIHEAIEAYKLERPYPGIPQAADPWWRPFLHLMESHAPVIMQTEANIFNRSRRYAGTLDTIGVWPSLREWKHPKTGELYFPPPWKDERGPVLLGDYKTGKGPRKGGVWPESALQEAAYSRGEFIETPEGDVEMPEVDGAIAVHLQPGWAEIVPVSIAEQVFQAFLYAYEVARWQLEISNTVIGRPMKVELPKEEQPDDKEQVSA